MASIRLRLLQPMAFLQAQGVRIEPFDAAKGADAYEAVVFSKSLCADGVALARRMAAAGKPVIFDICDNVFAGKDSRKKAAKTERLREMLGLADRVVFSTPILQAQMLAEMPGLGQRTMVIPDMMEDAEGETVPTHADARHLARLARFQADHAGAMRCIWFGKCQGNRAGLVHVDAAVRELEKFSAKRPVTLTIMGNRPLRYWLASRRWRVPHIYLPWSLPSFMPMLRQHDVAVVPLERNPYTLGKTINRPATALSAGLGVIADSIPAYEELRPFIRLDDWQGGLAHYHANDPRADGRGAEARAYLEAAYGRAPIGAAWLEMMQDAGLIPEQKGLPPVGRHWGNRHAAAA